MRPLLNKKLKLLSELTEHTLANEIEASYEILRKYQKYEKLRRYTEKMKGGKEILI